MNYIVFDLEATCEENNKEFDNETIEIGAVKLDDNYSIVGKFQTFVKPVRTPILTDYCKNLTSISQIDVVHAPSFKDAYDSFKDFVNIDNPYVMCSWGFYDKHQLDKDCRYHNINGWHGNHISLKHQFSDIRGSKKGFGMARALKALNLTLEGTHHRGIDDAMNIVKIFIALKGKWIFP